MIHVSIQSKWYLLHCTCFLLKNDTSWRAMEGNYCKNNHDLTIQGRIGQNVLMHVVLYNILLTTIIINQPLKGTNSPSASLVKLQKMRVCRRQISLLIWLWWAPTKYAITVEGSLFRHKFIISPSKFATCHAHIRQDPLVSPCKLHSRTRKDEIGNPV